MSTVFPSESSSPHLDKGMGDGISPKKDVQSEFRWTGPVQDSSTRFIVGWLEERLSQLNAGVLQRKRIVHIAIELLQNLHHHAASPVSGTTFQIDETAPGIWSIRTRNRLAQEDVQALQDRWEQLKNLGTADLRQAQRERVAQEERSSHGGGGIGLNDILRKTDGQAEMNISQEEQHVFVTFTAALPLHQ